MFIYSIHITILLLINMDEVANKMLQCFTGKCNGLDKMILP